MSNCIYYYLRYRVHVRTRHNSWVSKCNEDTGYIPGTTLGEII